MKLRVSSAIHERAQEQVNRSSQRLQEKEVSKYKTRNVSQNTDMEGIEGEPSNNQVKL